MRSSSSSLSEKQPAFFAFTLLFIVIVILIVDIWTPTLQAAPIASAQTHLTNLRQPTSLLLVNTGASFLFSAIIH